MHALCLPLGASISLLIMFFFFDSMQLLFAVCTASMFNILLIFIYLFIFSIFCDCFPFQFFNSLYFFCSYCHCGFGLFTLAHVSVYNTPLHWRQSHIFWYLWPFYCRWTFQFYSVCVNCLHMGANRSLALNGW